jgi:TolB-like protein/Flp pilus assembly protein TadD/predicted Ser/Thr protein kinase
MTDSGTMDHIQAALAAFLEGRQTLAELETALIAGLHSARWTPGLVMDVLRDAVAAGRVPPETLRRLGLEEAGDPTVARPPSESVDSGAGAPVPREPIATGQLLGGRYRLERKLGEGGMGVVYLASDQEVEGEIFAIKVLTPEIRERPDALELLREEVRKTRTLAHPNIVGVYSLNVDRTGVFILMEYLEGKTLQALLDEDFGRGMRFDRAWPLIEDLGAALAYAHDHSVIHGDLKPANVFVTTSGRAKLLDFGIARAARGSRWGKDAAALGALTPAYASCEMLEYLPPDTRDDIYALACIIYEMLSGKHPFDRHNAVEARDAGEKPLPITALTARQNAALAQGLAFERAVRTATVEALLAGLAPGAAPAKPRAVFSRTTGVAALIVAAAVALAYFVADRFWFAKHRASEQPTTAATSIVSDKSIAVLPFTDMSEKKDQEYFADGMAEEIIDLLAKIPGLAVIGRTSSFQFKGKNEDLRTIGTQLNAAHVLEGSVRKSGEQVRITAQLINTRTGTHEWSETYDRQIGDVLKLQDAIAAAVVRELQLTVASADLQSRSTVKNADAYDLMLRGRHASDRLDKDGLDEAVTLFRRVLELDPTSADATAALAWAYDAQGEWGFVAPTTAFDQARRAAVAALRMNPNKALAHQVLGRVHLAYEWDWVAAENEFKQVATLAPGNGDAIDSEALLSMTLGRWDDALRKVKTALDQDPLDPPSLYVLTEVQMRLGHLAEAEAAMRRALDIRPTLGGGHYLLGLVMLARDDPHAALAEMQQETAEPMASAGLAIANFALGRKVDSDAELARMLKEHADDGAFAIAEVYAFRGQSDEAMHWLERAYVQKDCSLYFLKVEMPQVSLATDPRFKAFLRKMNLPE